ncbi:MAG: glycosyltransferase family 39 protein [Candidatus Peregrinibacteria bacterium]|nr:glycosyltransferase family 39 protein [Candidatus Peregrinibacteria bacterium]MDZ4245262.1 glycosyltransferase family 39 protein [Candidatus Gracilibacteria bacterium]
MNFLNKIVSKDLYAYLFILGLALIVFGNAMGGEFLYDDLLLIVENEFTKSFAHFVDWFTSSSTSGAGRELGNLWRPLPSAVYTLIYSLFGLSPAMHHITNIILHSINGYLVYKLLDKFSIEKIWCLLAALIFIVHPVQAESVSYISGLPDVLSTLFVLLALNSYAEISDKKPTQLIKTGGFFVLALLTKESVVVLFPLAILIDIFNWQNYGAREKNFRKKSLALLGAMTLIFIIAKFTILNFNKDLALTHEKNPYTEHVYVRLITFTSILIQYVKLLVYPLHLYIDKEQTVFTTLLKPQGLAGLAILGTILIGSYRSFKNKRFFMLAGLWFLCALIPVSGIILTNSMYFEHWLYLPIIGLLIMLAAALNNLNSHNQKIAITVLLLVAVLFGTRTIIRNRDWHDAITFFKHELKYTENPGRVHHQIGTAYLRADNYPEAINELKVATSLNQENVDTQFSLCLAYYLNKQLPLAGIECQKALQIDPSHKASMMTLYNIAVTTGNLPLASELNQKLRAIGVTQ